MAGDAARVRAVPVSSRRVTAVRRLLVLGGLLIAGWLLGCAAQSAHADEVPAAPSRVVAKAPVLEHAVEAATERRSVSDVVRAVVEQSPPQEKAEEPVSLDAAPPPKISAGVQKTGDTSVADGVPVSSRPHWRTHEPVAAQPDSTAGGQVTQWTVRHDPAPMQAPELPDDHSVAGGLAGAGVTVGFSSGVAWMSAPALAPFSRAFGAVPPAVRTAADEPSFAPD